MLVALDDALETDYNYSSGCAEETSLYEDLQSKVDTATSRVWFDIRQFGVATYNDELYLSSPHAIKVQHGDLSAVINKKNLSDALQALPLNVVLTDHNIEQIAKQIIQDLSIRHKSLVSGEELLHLSLYYLNQLGHQVEVGANYQRLCSREVSDWVHETIQGFSAAQYAALVFAYEVGL